MAKVSQPKNQQRTAVIYFGSERETYLHRRVSGEQRSVSAVHPAAVYTWSGMERSWTPGWVWSLLQWLGNLLPVAWLLVRLGLTPPKHVLSDEKFAALDGQQICLFLVSQGELIWYTEWLKQANEEAFKPAIANFLTAINTEPQRQKQCPLPCHLLSKTRALVGNLCKRPHPLQTAGYP